MLPAAGATAGSVTLATLRAAVAHAEAATGAAAGHLIIPGVVPLLRVHNAAHAHDAAVTHRAAMQDTTSAAGAGEGSAVTLELVPPTADPVHTALGPADRWEFEAEERAAAAASGLAAAAAAAATAVAAGTACAPAQAHTHALAMAAVAAGAGGSPSHGAWPAEGTLSNSNSYSYYGSASASAALSAAPAGATVQTRARAGSAAGSTPYAGPASASASGLCGPASGTALAALYGNNRAHHTYSAVGFRQLQQQQQQHLQQLQFQQQQQQHQHEADCAGDDGLVVLPYAPTPPYGAIALSSGGPVASAATGALSALHDRSPSVTPSLHGYGPAPAPAGAHHHLALAHSHSALAGASSASSAAGNAAPGAAAAPALGPGQLSVAQAAAALSAARVEVERLAPLLPDVRPLGPVWRQLAVAGAGAADFVPPPEFNGGAGGGAAGSSLLPTITNATASAVSAASAAATAAALPSAAPLLHGGAPYGPLRGHITRIGSYVPPRPLGPLDPVPAFQPVRCCLVETCDLEAVVNDFCPVHAFVSTQARTDDAAVRLRAALKEEARAAAYATADAEMSANNSNTGLVVSYGNNNGQSQPPSAPVLVRSLSPPPLPPLSPSSSLRQISHHWTLRVSDNPVYAQNAYAFIVRNRAHSIAVAFDKLTGALRVVVDGVRILSRRLDLDVAALLARAHGVPAAAPAAVALHAPAHLDAGRSLPWGGSPLRLTGPPQTLAALTTLRLPVGVAVTAAADAGSAAASFSDAAAVSGGASNANGADAAPWAAVPRLLPRAGPRGPSAAPLDPVLHFNPHAVDRARRAFAATALAERVAAAATRANDAALVAAALAAAGHAPDQTAALAAGHAQLVQQQQQQQTVPLAGDLSASAYPSYAASVSPSPSPNNAGGHSYNPAAANASASRGSSSGNGLSGAMTWTGAAVGAGALPVSVVQMAEAAAAVNVLTFPFAFSLRGERTLETSQCWLLLFIEPDSVLPSVAAAAPAFAASAAAANANTAASTSAARLGMGDEHINVSADAAAANKPPVTAEAAAAAAAAAAVAATGADAVNVSTALPLLLGAVQRQLALPAAAAATCGAAAALQLTAPGAAALPAWVHTAPAAFAGLGYALPADGPGAAPRALPSLRVRFELFIDDAPFAAARARALRCVRRIVFADDKLVHPGVTTAANIAAAAAAAAAASNAASAAAVAAGQYPGAPLAPRALPVS